MKKNVLFVQRATINHSGGQHITNRNLKILETCFGSENVLKFQIEHKPKGAILLQTLFGYMGGLTQIDEVKILDMISIDKIEIVFLDTSLLGRLTSRIKAAHPSVVIFTFFHNIESKYFRSLLTSTKKIHHLLSVRSAALNEKLACIHSDYIITMNNRDSDLLFEHSGRRSDLLWPTSFEDKFDSSKVIPAKNDDELNILFVGGRFFANEEGVLWFVREVCPFLENSIFYVVGRGFEELYIPALPKNVEIIGTVDDLESFYYNSDIVVSPIFSGGGMKTKTGEALMYGRFIAGTKEAFEGYDVDFDRIGRVCNTADEFINYINTFDRKKEKVNSFSRNAFINRFSTQTILQQFKIFIDEAM